MTLFIKEDEGNVEEGHNTVWRIKHQLETPRSCDVIVFKMVGIFREILDSGLNEERRVWELGKL